MLIHPLILTVSQAAPQQSSSLFQLKKQRHLLVRNCYPKPDVLRSLRIRSLYCHCTRNTTLIGAFGLCTRGFDGVDEWIPIGLTPADREDVEGVHVNYQLRHWLFQACKNTFCSRLMLHILLYFTYSVILNCVYQKKKKSGFCLPPINVRLSSPEQSCWVYTNEQVEGIPDESQAG